MADPVAIWGAITGTGAVVMTVRREFFLNRARLGIEHGVHFLVSEQPTVGDAWLLIRIWNRGGQPLTVERVGLKYFPTWIEGEELHVDAVGGLAEIELQGVPIELTPGGPSRRLYAPLRGLSEAGIDVLDCPAFAWARTSDREEWHGEVHAVVPSRVPNQFREPFREYQEEIGAVLTEAAVYVALPNLGPPNEGGLEA